MFWRFTYPGNGFLSFFTDDFFYYLKVAENINNHHLSSFDGIHLTNGYHPLWMILLVGMLKITGTSSTAFFMLLALLISVLNLSVYVLTFQTCLHFLSQKTVSCFIAFLTTVFCLQITKSGMEVALAIPMIFIVIKYMLNNEDLFFNRKKILVLGFLSSILVLSRLDAALFVLLLLIPLADFKAGRKAGGNLLFFGLGGILVPAYLILNSIVFDTMMPVSGQVKHLKNDLLPSLNAIISLVQMRPQRIFVISTLIALLFCIIPFLKEKPIERKKYFPLLCTAFFALAHIIVLSFSSNWRLWSWYTYPFVPLFCSVAIYLVVYLDKKAQILRFSQQNGVLSVLIALSIMYGFVFSARSNRAHSPKRNSIYGAALKIADFEKKHKGLYAMGDRAGTVGYLLKSPLIQMEGLVMDKPFMKNIERSRNLNDVLAEYKVDYYIATNPKMTEGHYRVVEPAQAGNNSPRMEGRFSCRPVQDFVLNNVHTAIFALKDCLD